MVAPTVIKGWLFVRWKFRRFVRATKGRPYRGKWDNEFQFVDFLFERIFVYQIWLHPISKSSTQPVGATIGRPFLVLPQKDMETL